MDIKRLSLLHRLTRILDRNQFGTVDYELAKFFLENYRSIGAMNIYEIAEQNFVSRASIRRFACHIGYENFAEMKQHFQDFDEGAEVYRAFHGAADFRTELYRALSLMMKELNVRMNSSEVSWLVKEIEQVEEVAFIASSHIAGILQTFQQELVIFGKRVTLLSNKEDICASLDYFGPETMVIVFSISGLLAETLAPLIDRFTGKKILFTLKRAPTFNRGFGKIYHLRSQENTEVPDVLYYSYAVHYVLDVILSEFLKLKAERNDFDDL
ncbi:MurR/RpiR family transcriptional regulator [Listeria costaricensis]|uniref:MurR/RpiR family transcriptional regulator n=1 Tax=Listeria costaricensis TaxID=2026604 RepID=UPI000C06CBCD|nr:MurR/RpiR family transcriptional regulator [Listeria costaricensis]